MAQVTAPVILDSTGQQIVTALNNLSNNVKPTADQIKRTNSNNQTVEAALVSLNSQLAVAAVTFTSYDALKSGIQTKAGTMASGSIASFDFRANFSTTEELPNAYYTCIIRKYDNNSYLADIISNTGVDYKLSYAGNAWKLTSLSSQIAERAMNQITLPNSVTSCVITGVGNWQYCSLLFMGLVNGKGATLMALNTTGNAVGKTHLGGSDCTDVLSASFSGTSLTLSASSSSNSFRGLVIASQGITSAT